MCIINYACCYLNYLICCYLNWSFEWRCACGIEFDVFFVLSVSGWLRVKWSRWKRGGINTTRSWWITSVPFISSTFHRNCADVWLVDRAKTLEPWRRDLVLICFFRPNCTALSTRLSAFKVGLCAVPIFKICLVSVKSASYVQTCICANYGWAY